MGQKDLSDYQLSLQGNKYDICCFSHTSYQRQIQHPVIHLPAVMELFIISFFLVIVEMQLQPVISKVMEEAVQGKMNERCEDLHHKSRCQKVHNSFRFLSQIYCKLKIGKIWIIIYKKYLMLCSGYYLISSGLTL